MDPCGTPLNAKKRENNILDHGKLNAVGNIICNHL